ncbi:2OG-Fe(II) oxygenase [Streptomyces justiciae]|uniref:2OG-Fe(II) oxygenase n=1 Tax=Streptomyces justiciae TaxID=2780140 RepID=UPI0018813441|nr:2OG-Fe(II) oxygenase [Streptomyces justiciae]MBE8474525.1 2OG-Fe(II) oxygenase [Streptomyces justiciae]MCW8378918.1 2OG-Fe(II) oxygenase [Streptomyces justiciae]
MFEPFYFSSEPLSALADQHRDAFRNARPFPHVVLNDFLPNSVLDKVVAEFPEPGSTPWKRFDKATSKKLASEGDAFFGEFTRHVLTQFNSATFLGFLEDLTGIDGLVGDPYFEGGGLHQIERGGFLKVHADFNRHEKLRLDRRLNVLVYLNKDWEESYGGALELWNREMTRAEKRIFPVFNRFMVFATTDFAYHGHPEPLACPPDRTRRSMALYYYTNGRPTQEQSSGHSTLYQARPGERRARARRAVERVTPPVLLDAARHAKRRMVSH